LEKCEFVDQKMTLKFFRIQEFILSHQDVFRRQGSVVSNWRSYRGRRLGPFFSLRYRVDGRQSAIYLGRSARLSERVRGLLAEIQQKRNLSRLIRTARADLRKTKKLWQQDLAALNLELKGFEVRGWRGLQKTALSGADST
jgi:hypothetical protein